MNGNSSNPLQEQDTAENQTSDVLLRNYEEIEEQIKMAEEKEVNYTKEINHLELELIKVKEQYKTEHRLRKKYKHNYDQIRTSRSWKISSPVRKLLDILKNKEKETGKNEGNQNKQQDNASDSTVSEMPAGNAVTAKDLEKKLFGGFSQYALPELVELKESPRASLFQRTKAASILAKWYNDKNENEKALKELEFMNELKPMKRPNINRIIPELKVLKKLGATKEARKLLWETIDIVGLDAELCLAMAHITDDPAERLTWYNLLYNKSGYSPIELVDPSKPLSIENIDAPSPSVKEGLEDYKVSVIIPAFKAADMIHIALDSLLKQTIKNLEIIVVDDFSPDNTAEVVAKYAEQDSRIKLIKKEVNQGAYMARNTALQHVTGDYITIHDSDDWSHPQKIEVQLKEIVHTPNCKGSLSYLIRALEDTSPVNAGSLLSEKYIMLNSSSLLLHKSVFEKLGAWDSVRVAGDTEFLWRIEQVFGADSIVRVEPKVPFSLALSNETSLTGMTTTHVRTIMYGLRRTYRESFKWWHATNAESHDDLYMDPSKTNRFFPCPIPNVINKPASRFYDAIIIGDFASEQGQQLAENMMERAASKYEKVAIFHWPNYTSDPAAAISDNVYETVRKYQIDLLVTNEEVEAAEVFVISPEVLDYALDSAPVITSSTTYIVNREVEGNEQSKKLKEENLDKTMGLQAEQLSVGEAEAKFNK
ncbi:hypothetical protein CR203_05975 [Salipaludibacillus neizhouensis]|uniref:Glycosyltransferase 2-like domain-containing protein n=1 Tax=Salipaludibacillus neizhouensis TaxID=885475 RepID=A0A3A9KEI2_9BACI|nr:glycosyltransferase family A protein [Salipaludibacillus neizhouensis]RKL68043.1 hypothetical protein CR203_05975 [Salipaludibacillus neizhouensis]